MLSQPTAFSCPNVSCFSCFNLCHAFPVPRNKRFWKYRVGWTHALIWKISPYQWFWFKTNSVVCFFFLLFPRNIWINLIQTKINNNIIKTDTKMVLSLYTLYCYTVTNLRQYTQIFLLIPYHVRYPKIFCILCLFQSSALRSSSCLSVIWFRTPGMCCKVRKEEERPIQI